MDRFCLRVRLGYPTPEDESDILAKHQRKEPLDTLQSVLSPRRVMGLRRRTHEIHVSSPLRAYMVNLAGATREHSQVELGVSLRGSIALMRACQARALMHDRPYAIPEDAKALALSVLGHRLLLAPSAHAKNLRVEDIIEEIVKNTKIPSGSHEEGSSR